MVSMHISKKAAIITLLVMAGIILLQPHPVVAHTPGSLDLFYDYGNQRLFVTIGHNVINNLTHYISQINITVNEAHYSTINYVSQEDKAGMTDDFPVTASDGDVIGVTAYCSEEGSIHDEITVVATESIPNTSPTNTGLTDINTTTDGGNAMPPELMIIVAAGGLAIILVAAILVKSKG